MSIDTGAVGTHEHSSAGDVSTDATDDTATNGPCADRTEIESDMLIEEISIDGMCGVY